MLSNTLFIKRDLTRTKMGAVSACVLLSACTVGPDYKTPSHEVLPASLSRHYRPATEGQGGREPWWSAFHSHPLDEVMRGAIDGNLELVAADATLRQAAAFVDAAQGSLYPQIDFAADAGRQRTRGASGLVVGNAYAVGPRVGFDLDAFGGTRRKVEQQQAFAELQKHRYEGAYLTLTGNVASQVFLMASASAQLDAVDKLLANDAKNLELVSMASLKGAATQVDISLAQTRLAQDRTLLAPLAQQRDLARHALSILTGKSPGDGVVPDFDLAGFVLPSNLPLSVPSESAHDRPDVLQAEAQLHVASAAVGIATANLYPHIELSASLAQSAAGNGGAALWGIAAGLTGPIFNGGTLKAERQAAVDGYQASLASYRQTLIESFGQVADTLQAIKHDSAQNQAQEDALGAAETSLRLNQQAYAQGENSLLQVLEAGRAYEHAVLGQIKVKTAQYLDAVQLFVALGGNAVGSAEQRMANREEQQSLVR